MFGKLFAICIAVTACAASYNENYISGVERLNLNADRASNVWSAYGSNTTGQGMI